MKTLQLDSINYKSSLALECVRLEAGPYPSISFSIMLKDNSYSGENQEVWFSFSDVAAFRSAVTQLHLTRKGTASLDSMSPEAFKLSIQSVNRKGDFILEYLLSRHVYLEHSSATSRVSGAFDMNPSDLERLASYLSTFVSEESL
ncbi:WapI family immunity protein [Paenibacillus sinopodophylli]|uniref:WapI family immunity protein n=1 Tax=Paenibacillus sinopodophylli TaxID=1837342 RepID=UPI00110CD178|nr:hypothetical protein [Paenibacillus sinopodophylli]